MDSLEYVIPFTYLDPPLKLFATKLLTNMEKLFTNPTAHPTHSKISTQKKRLNFINAAQDLGIDKGSFCSFLTNSIEYEQNQLSLLKPLLTRDEYLQKRRSIMEADLVRLILQHF